MEKENAKNIWQKLLGLQKAFKTFAVTEDAAKKDSKGKSEYKYTPGWQIVELLREKMDALSLMLIPNIIEEQNKMIEYPVYKLIGGAPVTFNKKEVYVTIKVEFTWKDAETGEEAGPFTMIASGSNGTDKSCATALSFAERYFLLKFFHITTRETDEEPDAHDSNALPGIPASAQPASAQPYQPYGAAPVGCPLGAPAPQTGPSAPSAPSYTPQSGQQFDPNNPAIAAAADKLSHYVFGTPGFQSALNEVIGTLQQSGFQCFAPGFIENISEMAKAKREGRVPQFK